MNHVTKGGGTNEHETETGNAQYGGAAVAVKKPNMQRSPRRERGHAVAEKHQEVPGSHIPDKKGAVSSLYIINVKEWPTQSPKAREATVHLQNTFLRVAAGVAPRLRAGDLQEYISKVENPFSKTCQQGWSTNRSSSTGRSTKRTKPDVRHAGANTIIECHRATELARCSQSNATSDKSTWRETSCRSLTHELAVLQKHDRKDRGTRSTGHAG